MRTGRLAPRAIAMFSAGAIAERTPSFAATQIQLECQEC
jgi:hypothetical protein